MRLENLRFVKKRFFSFLESELGLYNISLNWLKENLSNFNDFKESFVKEEGFEQAHIMHDGCIDSDNDFCAFYNYKKLDGNPLIVESKEKYAIDDLFVVCYKCGYSMKEALYFCTDQSQHKDLSTLFKHLESEKQYQEEE